MSLLELHDINKTYIGRKVDSVVFRSINLTIEEGEYIGIYGRSGSGKSTLLNMIGLVDLPTSGEITLEGKKLRSLDDEQYAFIRNKYVGYIFQDFKLVEDMTVYENIEVPLLFSKEKLPTTERNVRITNLLKDLGLEGKGNAFPEELSGGQKRRVAIARALVNKPKLLIADEPTGNLDSASSEDVMRMITRIQKENRMTVIIATHDNYIKEFVNRIIHVEDNNLREG